MKRSVSILDAIADPKLFGPWFARGDWTAWRAFLAALFGLPMDADMLAIYQRHTGRTSAPTSAFGEAWLVCGRRAGKSFVMALCAVWLACFRTYRQHLQPGEVATIAVLAADRKQARTIMRYVTGMVQGIPMVKRIVKSETAEGFEFTNGTVIEVTTASSRATRGYTFGAVLADEIAFWPTGDDAADPDSEILNAIRPGMATIPGAMLICASSPYARKGTLWDAHDKYHGKDGAPVLVWQSATRDMNPSVPQRVIDDATERDPQSAAAEYGALFRTDVEQFVRREVIKDCTDTGIHEREPQASIRYFGFVDPSGGSADSFTMAIAHRRDDRIILDMVREVKPPFSPEAVVDEFAHDLKRYGIRVVYGDRYAGEWPREQFAKRDIVYTVADMVRSDLYLNLLPLLNSGKARLLDNPRLAQQLIGLERRTARAGKDSIDHRRGSHDDLANAVAGVLCKASRRDPSQFLDGNVIGFSICL
ncbi:MAG: terminase family protein [Rudaea sp.]|uniref:terminase large subunit domain-containing protein n=1 Tax=Rudaea sp. TaxID=2136325 RepID=UPI0039E559ED